jgi:hypothetical protein
MVKTNIRYSILGLVLFLMLFGNIRSQVYDVAIWNLPVGIAELEQIADNEISFKLKSNEFIDYVFPIDLDYYSKFDKNNYTIIENKKTTEQKTEEQNFEAILDGNNVLVYNDQDSISLEPNTHSLLSLLNKLMNSSVDSIDTKWFNLENEGILYQTRFLWNDTTTISVKNTDILCDHYRLDLKIVNDDSKIFEKTDYFNELFFDINSIRQIWVEKWQKKQRIIKITIKNSLTNLTIAIKN